MSNGVPQALDELRGEAQLEVKNKREEKAKLELEAREADPLFIYQGSNVNTDLVAGINSCSVVPLTLLVRI